MASNRTTRSRTPATPQTAPSGAPLRLTRATVLPRGDDVVVDEAVRHLNRLWREGLLGTVVAVGDYLIEKFYGGSPEEARSQRPNKPSALRQLLERAEELPVSPHALKQAVRVAAQYHELPLALAEGLTKTQHELLLPVADPAAKRKLAQEAVESKLTSEALKGRVRRVHRPHKGGRPPKPAVRRRLGALLRALEAGNLDEDLAPASLKRLDAAEIRAGLAEAKRARELVERILDAIKRHR